MADFGQVFMSPGVKTRQSYLLCTSMSWQSSMAADACYYSSRLDANTAKYSSSRIEHMPATIHCFHTFRSCILFYSHHQQDCRRRSPESIAVHKGHWLDSTASTQVQVDRVRRISIRTMWNGAHLYVDEDLDHDQPPLEVPEGLEMSGI